MVLDGESHVCLSNLIIRAGERGYVRGVMRGWVKGGLENGLEGGLEVELERNK